MWFPTFPLLRDRASLLAVRDPCKSSDSVFDLSYFIFKFPESREEGFNLIERHFNFDNLVISFCNPVLKLINNSSRENKENHYRDRGLDM